MIWRTACLASALACALALPQGLGCRSGTPRCSPESTLSGYALDRLLARQELLRRLEASSDGSSLRNADINALRRGIEREREVWCSNPLSPDVTPTRLSVEDFGARGDGIADDSAAFVRAIDFARQQGGAPTVLHVGKGVFRLATSIGLPYGRRGHLDFGGLTNFAVKGVSPQETKLVLADYDAMGFAMQHSRNVAFRDFDVSYEKTPFSQGEVESVDIDAATVVVRHKPGTLRPDGPEFRKRWRKGGSAGLVCGVFTHDCRRIHAPSFFYRIDADDLGDGRYLVRMNGEHPSWKQVTAQNLPVGSVLVIPDRGVGPVFDCNAASWVDFVDVWVRNARSAAFIAFGGEYVSGVRVKVFPKSQDLALSTNADGFYGSPGVYLVDSEFRNMNDDGGNCHMKACPVVARLGPRTLVHRLHGGTARPGDMLRLYHADGSVSADLTIASTRWGEWKKGEKLAFITETAEDIPPGVVTEADVPRPLTKEEWTKLESGVPVEIPQVADISFVPQGYGMGYVVKNCVFSDFRGTGVVVQCPNALLVSNRFERINVGIRQGALLRWREGIEPYNVTEFGNAFVDVPVMRERFVQPLMPGNKQKNAN